MGTLAVSHEYDCTGATLFTSCILNRAYNEELYGSLGFPRFEWLELRDEGTKRHRKIRVAPPTGNLPGTIKKLIGDGLSYVEEGTYDPATTRYEFRVYPSALGEKADVRGAMWCVPRGSGCVRHASFDAHVRVFGIGGMIEERILASYKKAFDVSATFTKAYLQRNGLTGQ